MKYGIVISVSKTKFGPVVFKGNLIENIIKASKLRYDGVELAVRKLEAFKINEVKDLIKKYSLAVLSIGTGQNYGEEGLSFSNQDKKIITHRLSLCNYQKAFETSEKRKEGAIKVIFDSF